MSEHPRGQTSGSAGQFQVAAAGDPSQARKALLPAALTLLGSSGALSVFGPLTGHLYWEGFLAPFGLTPEEFPAVPSRVIIYEYNAILNGALSVIEQLWAWMPFLGVTLTIVALVSIASKFPKVRSGMSSVIQAVRRRLTGVDAASLAFQGITQLSLFILALLVVGYFVLLIVVLALGPHQARQLGQREGERARAAHASASASSAACMSIVASGVTFSCPTVIAYSDKVIAVLDRSRVYRVNRDNMMLSSTPVPSAPGASGSASSGASQ